VYELTDEEGILKNYLIQIAVYDVARNLELFPSSKETKENISTADGDTESVATFSSSCS
jgi:hypothetical protein